MRGKQLQGQSAPWYKWFNLGGRIHSGKASRIGVSFFEDEEGCPLTQLNNILNDEYIKQILTLP
jgi:hypothetical protein